MNRSIMISSLVAAVTMAAAPDARAQNLGTFRWQLQPYCNVVTVTLVQEGAVYAADGYDDQCGAAQRAPLVGLATPNPDGTIGFGLHVVTVPGGRAIAIDARVTLPTASGTWSDSAGNAGTFAFGAATSGSPRPAPPGLRTDGGFLAGGTFGAGTIPASGAGARMMWFPKKAAFRAGTTAGTEWDEAKVGEHSTAFGYGTTASGNRSTAMGNGSTASGLYSTAMGDRTTASGDWSTAMGAATTANGALSTTMGSSARTTASGSGSFVYGDAATNLVVESFVPNQFLVRASGGVIFWSTVFTTFPTSPGVVLFSGDSAWSSLSDVNAKEHFTDLAGEDVLAKLAAMPVREWNYKAQDAAIRHIGPTAQDFHAAFGLGVDPRRINTIDADGVALAGVKALEARTQSLARENDALRAELAALTAAVDDLRAALAEKRPDR